MNKHSIKDYRGQNRGKAGKAGTASGREESRSLPLGKRNEQDNAQVKANYATQRHFKNNDRANDEAQQVTHKKQTHTRDGGGGWHLCGGRANDKALQQADSGTQRHFENNARANDKAQQATHNHTQETKTLRKQCQS